MATPGTFQLTEQPIPVFSGENYDYWSIRIRATLMSRGLWEVVSEGKDEVALEAASAAGSEAAVEKEIIMKDMAALHILHMAVVDSIFPLIAPAKSSKEAWDLLQAQFQGLTKVRTFKHYNLSREFETLRMEENEGVKEYADKLVRIANRMGFYGEKKKDREIVGKILTSLPPRYNDIVCVIVGVKDLETLTVTELVGSLHAHELRMASYEENCSIQDKETTVKSSGNGKCAKQCFKCQKFGHYARECRSKPVTASQTNHLTEDGDLLFSSNCDSTILENNGVWVVSTATPNHMANDPSLFVNMDRSAIIPFRSASGQVVKSAGKGDVRIATKNGHKILKDVLYVPGIHKNILSVSQMTDDDCTVAMGCGRCKIHDTSGKLIGHIKMVNNLYQVGADHILSKDPPVQFCSLYPF